MNIKKAYNEWAAHYDSDINKTRELDKKVTKRVLSNYDFETVLELGCGTGKNTVWLLKKAKRIIALDFSQAMLNIAQEKITDEKVEFIQTDLRKDWPVANRAVDLVTCSLTLEHIQELKHIFKQTRLKLKNNSLFFISELHPFKQYLGSKAKYETENGIIELEVYKHHISDYIIKAENNGFELIEIKEWFDNNSDDEIPRLISFVFKKL